MATHNRGWIINTFLPYPSFHESAVCLDSVRRFKQVLEARALVRALGQGPRCRWRRADKTYVYGPPVPTPGHDVRVTPNYNHPACVMWRGHAHALMWYTNAMLVEVIKRKTHTVTAFGPYDLRGPGVPEVIPLPPWLGDPAFHAAQRSNLLRKDPAFYGAYGWAEGPDLPYVWPPDPSISEEVASERAG